MNKTNSSLTVQTDCCHNISVENYFLSPKMPVKDHSLAFKSTKTSFKPNQTSQVPTLLSKKVKGVLETVDMNDSEICGTLSKNMNSLSKMNLLKEKNLCVINHQGIDKSLSSCTHTRQTNPGYSRNTLGGVYTK